MGNALIYVIDDDKANNFLSKIMFGDVGIDNIKQFYMVEPAISELKKVCSEHNTSEYPDIILLDINMPIKDGWDFLNELKALNCNFPNYPKIFITTSSDHPRDTEKAKNFPEVIEFLPKPLTLETAAKLKEEYMQV